MDGPLNKHKRLGDAITETLLDYMENGVPVLDGDGKTVLNDAGEAIRTPPTAALVTAAINWWKQMNQDGDGAAEGFQAILERAQQGREAGGKLPDVGDGEDAATA